MRYVSGVGTGTGAATGGLVAPDVLRPVILAALLVAVTEPPCAWVDYPTAAPALEGLALIHPPLVLGPQPHVSGVVPALLSATTLALTCASMVEAARLGLDRGAAGLGADAHHYPLTPDTPPRALSARRAGVVTVSVPKPGRQSLGWGC